MHDRFAIAAALREIGALLGLKGESPFKTQAYERGAMALENLDDDLDKLVRTGRLTDIPAVGKTLAAIIEEIYRAGECWLLQQLRQETPPGAIALSALPGLNLKKIKALHDVLGIASIADLKAACEKDEVKNVQGFGARSQAKLLAHIAKLEAPSDGSLAIDRALREASQILQHIRNCPELIRADIAGALRRSKETVRRICIVAAAAQPKPVIDRFLSFPALARTEEIQETGCIARLAGGLAAELVVTQPDFYASILHGRTGSRRHVAKLEHLARAKARDPFGAEDRDTQKPPRDEAEIYRRLELQFIPPEMREDEGEIEAAAVGTLPQPLELCDIRGMTHCHTIYSDGKNSVEEMALAAEAKGLAYLTITDHSPSAHYAGGVAIDRLRAQWDEIDRVQERVKIKLLKGTESDIREHGFLDYPDYILERFDVINASIHARHSMDAAQMTERLLRALQLPFFKIWGHPLGRLIGSRPPFACRMDEVLDAVARSRCAIEVNGDPRRLDLEPQWIRAARRRGIKFIVSTGAHSIASMNHLCYGVATARRGWLTREEVLNTQDVSEFMRAVRP